MTLANIFDASKGLYKLFNTHSSVAECSKDGNDDDSIWIMFDMVHGQTGSNVNGQLQQIFNSSANCAFMQFNLGRHSIHQINRQSRKGIWQPLEWNLTNVEWMNAVNGNVAHTRAHTSWIHATWMASSIFIINTRRVAGRKGARVRLFSAIS